MMDSKRESHETSSLSSKGIEEAIRTLDQFNQQQKNWKNAPFFDTIIRLIFGRFSEAHSRGEGEVQSAVQLLSAHQGPLEEAAHRVIQQFNGYLDHWKENSKLSAREKVMLFLSQHGELWSSLEKVSLGEKKSVLVCEEAPPPPFTSSQKVAELKQTQALCQIPFPTIEHLSLEASSLFFMKMISILEMSHGMGYKEARTLVGKAKIFTQVEANQELCVVGHIYRHDGSLAVTLQGLFKKRGVEDPLYSIPKGSPVALYLGEDLR